MKNPLFCTVCGKPYIGPTDLYICTYCGASVEPRLELSRGGKDFIDTIKARGGPGVWRYKALLPAAGIQPVSLGEGGAPLLHGVRLGEALGVDRLYIKNEGLNPTGTYKDRFAAVELSIQKSAGTKAVALGSAGNAAAAVAAYSAVTGIKCFIILPPGAVQERAWQNMSYGAKFIQAQGTINDCIQMVARGEKLFGWKNVCTTMMHSPYGAEGYKTIAYEIARDMDFEAPDYIVVPVGGGILISKIYRGYTEMRELGLIDKIPKMIGVQAEGCAPLVKAFEAKAKKTEPWENPKTVAFAINDSVTFEGVTALDVIYKSGGMAVSVSDDEILSAMRLCAEKEAVLAEPASAASVACVNKIFKQGILKRENSVVCIVTGSALKDLKLFAEGMETAPSVRLNDFDALEKAVDFYGGVPK